MFFLLIEMYKYIMYVSISLCVVFTVHLDREEQEVQDICMFNLGLSSRKQDIILS